jgi:hypothetical protein
MKETSIMVNTFAPTFSMWAVIYDENEKDGEMLIVLPIVALESWVHRNEKYEHGIFTALEPIAFSEDGVFLNVHEYDGFLAISLWDSHSLDQWRDEIDDLKRSWARIKDRQERQNNL